MVKKNISDDRIKEILSDKTNYTKESDLSIERTMKKVDKLEAEMIEIHRKILLLL